MSKFTDIPIKKTTLALFYLLEVGKNGYWIIFVEMGLFMKIIY